MDIYVGTAIGFLLSCLLLFLRKPLFICEVYLDAETQSVNTKIDIRKLGLWIAILAIFYLMVAFGLYTYYKK